MVTQKKVRTCGESLSFDLLKEFDQIESSQKLDFWGLCAVPNKQTKPGFFFPKGPIFLHSCATCSELPSDISSVLCGPIGSISF